MKRRHFLKSAAILAGGPLTRSSQASQRASRGRRTLRLQYRPRRDEIKSVLVIGAGISGLCAATVLKKSGLNVTVLEGSDQVGGRMSTERSFDGEIIDKWAQVLNTGYEVIPALQKVFETAHPLKSKSKLLLDS